MDFGKCTDDTLHFLFGVTMVARWQRQDKERALSARKEAKGAGWQHLPQRNWQGHGVWQRLAQNPTNDRHRVDHICNGY